MNIGHALDPSMMEDTIPVYPNIIVGGSSELPVSQPTIVPLLSRYRYQIMIVLVIVTILVIAYIVYVTYFSKQTPPTEQPRKEDDLQPHKYRSIEQHKEGGAIEEEHEAAVAPAVKIVSKEQALALKQSLQRNKPPATPAVVEEAEEEEAEAEAEEEEELIDEEGTQESRQPTRCRHLKDGVACGMYTISGDLCKLHQ